MISETCLKLKRDHDTVNGIINGYYPLGRMLTRLGMNKSVTNFGQLGQFGSDQVTAQVGYHAAVQRTQRREKFNGRCVALARGRPGDRNRRAGIARPTFRE